MEDRSIDEEQQRRRLGPRTGGHGPCVHAVEVRSKEGKDIKQMEGFVCVG